MAMSSGGGYGSRSYSSYRTSYTTYSPITKTNTITYTLEEAVEKASQGSLSPSEVYDQMSGPLQNEVENLASQQFSSSFSSLNLTQQRAVSFLSLNLTQQRAVMGSLSRKIKRAKEQLEKPVSIADALQMASAGQVDDIKLYRALPDELRKALDAFAGNLGATNFTAARPQVRQQILKGILMVLYQAEQRRLQALPWWKRLFARKPSRPPESNVLTSVRTFTLGA